MEKKSSVILASADHLSGELLAAAMEDILALGAQSVQAAPSIAKKRRPGTLLYIEPGSAEEKIAQYLARELKIGGYQRLDSAHVHFQTRFTRKKFIVTAEGRRDTFELPVKAVGPEGAELYTSVEADDAMMICRELEKRHGIIRSFHWVKGALDAASACDEAEIRVDL